MSDPASTKELTDTDEWIALIKETPLRSVEDIQLDREPTVIQPVLAVAMQPEPKAVRAYTGPRWWRPVFWLLWNFGDFIPRKKTRDQKQDIGRHRLVRGMPEAAVYRPQTSALRSSAASTTQGHISLPRHGYHVPRRFFG